MAAYFHIIWNFVLGQLATFDRKNALWESLDFPLYFG